MPRLHLTVTLCLLFLAGMAMAGRAVAPQGAADAITVPQLINYQGKLTDGNGNPIEGSEIVIFGIYDAASGGTKTWEETQIVSFSKGLFNVVLGSVTPISDLPDGPDCYLQVEVDGATLAPRTRVVSSAYSLKAADAGRFSGREIGDFMIIDSIVMGTINVTTGTPVYITLSIQHVSEVPQIWIGNAYPTQNAWYTTYGEATHTITDAGTFLYRNCLRITHHTGAPSTMNYRYVAYRLR